MIFVVRHHARLAGTLLAALVILASNATASAQPPPQPMTVDYLLQRLFGNENKPPYDLTAEFTGVLSVTVKGGTLVVEADGAFHEWRGQDGVKHRRVIVRNLTVPFLLRPFAQPLRRTVAERIEAQAENPEIFYAHDLFILNELPDNQFVVGGVHRSIVDEAIDKYGKPDDKKDPETRRKIAQWLFTAPTMRDFIVREGPPYALQATIDDTGLLHEITIFYNWGKVSTQVEFVTVNGRTVWSSVTADTVSNLPNIGQVSGQLSLVLTNHCVNCARQPAQGTP